MSDTSPSPHSQRSVSRSSTKSERSTHSDSGRRRSSRRSLLLDEESCRKISDSLQDPFGKDVFDLDPSAELTSSIDSFSTAFDSLSPFEDSASDDGPDLDNSKTSTEDFADFANFEEEFPEERRQSKRNSMRKSLSRREMTARGGSHRSLRTTGRARMQHERKSKGLA